MLVPRTSLLVAFALVMAPASALAAYDARVLWLMGAALLLFAADAWLAPRALNGIRVELPELVRMARARECAVTLRVHVDGASAKRIRVGLMMPDAVHAANEEMEIAAPAGLSAVESRWTSHQRGAHRIDACMLEGRSPLRLWAWRRTQPAACQVRVYPDLSSEQRRLAALSATHAGTHGMAQRGKGREVESLRDYVRDDSFEDIHWKATARRARPITKVYRVERTQEVYVAIDCSRLTARHAAGEVILERYISAGLVLGAAAQREGDLFGLVTFSDKVHGLVRARSGHAHYGACRDALLGLAPRPVSPDFEELAAELRLRLRRRAMLIVLTELDDPVIAEGFARAARLLGSVHLVTASMIRPVQSMPLFTGAEPASVDEIHQRLAAHMHWRKLDELRGNLHRMGVKLSLAEPDALAATLVGGYLSAKRRQLL